MYNETFNSRNDNQWSFSLGLKPRFTLSCSNRLFAAGTELEACITRFSPVFIFTTYRLFVAQNAFIFFGSMVTFIAHTFGFTLFCADWLFRAHVKF